MCIRDRAYRHQNAAPRHSTPACTNRTLGAPGSPTRQPRWGGFGLGALSSACAALFVNHNGLLRNCFQIERGEPALSHVWSGAPHSRRGRELLLPYPVGEIRIPVPVVRGEIVTACAYVIPAANRDERGIDRRHVGVADRRVAP